VRERKIVRKNHENMQFMRERKREARLITQVITISTVIPLLNSKFIRIPLFITMINLINIAILMALLLR
jgi:hypothetical protein